MAASLCCAGAAETPTPRKEPSAGRDPHAELIAIRSLVEGGNAFGLSLYSRLAAAKEGNLFFSPASIHTALAMTYAGARGGTADQMCRTLRFPMEEKLEAGKPDAGPHELEKRLVPWPKDKLHSAFGRLIEKLNTPQMVPTMEKGKVVRRPAYELTVCNALWGQKGFAFRAEFTKLVGSSYGAGLRHVDFVAEREAARRTINTWVEDQTKDKIKDLIPSGVLTPLTRLVLTNAIYFKSNWAEKFEKRATRDEDFTLAGGKKVKTPMMHQQRRFGYMEDKTCQVLEMPYRSGELSMLVLLPKKADGLEALEKALARKGLQDYLTKIRQTEVRLTLPKFKFTSSFRLADKLKAMGMTDAFSPAKADFSGMTTAQKLFISAVLHKAFVAVDEEGTEAAAATAVVMALTSVVLPPPKPKVFKADHPFVFVIRHRETGAVLFMGRVANPKGT
jgi:serpin B